MNVALASPRCNVGPESTGHCRQVGTVSQYYVPVGEEAAPYAVRANVSPIPSPPAVRSGSGEGCSFAPSCSASREQPGCRKGGNWQTR